MYYFNKKENKMISKQIKIIAQNIRIMRKAQGLTILDLSKKSGISFSTITAIENERSKNISINVIDKIASALNSDFITIVSPIAMQDNYLIPIKNFDEDDCVLAIEKKAVKNTYYPPTFKKNKITSMLELAIILPLIDLTDLYNVYYRILGSAVNYEEYISEQFEWCWNRVPDSPAKQYIQKELDYIHKIRCNNKLNIEDVSFSNNEGLEYLRDILENKEKNIKDLRNLISYNSLFSK